MTNARNPYLDSLLRGTAQQRPMTANEARKAASNLFRTNAPLRNARNPHLAKLIDLAKNEFDNPAYVDAIIRNFAELSPKEIYCSRVLEEMRETSLLHGTVDTSTMAGLATSLLFAKDVACLDDSADCDELDELFDAFVAPFDDVAMRFNLEAKSAAEPDEKAPAPKKKSSARRARPACDYRALAKRIGLRNCEANHLLLRFCLLPAGRYAQGVHRLSKLAVRPQGGEYWQWMLGTFLFYRSGERNEDFDLRVSRLAKEILEPLSEVGRQVCPSAVQPPIDPVTFF